MSGSGYTWRDGHPQRRAAYLTRLSDACARSAYRMKVGVPLDAAPYGVRASA